jgi:hypothetical protein
MFDARQPNSDLDGPFRTASPLSSAITMSQGNARREARLRKSADNATYGAFIGESHARSERALSHRRPRNAITLRRMSLYADVTTVDHVSIAAARKLRCRPNFEEATVT